MKHYKDMNWPNRVFDKKYINASFCFLIGENAGSKCYSSELDLDKLIEEAKEYVAKECALQRACAVRIRQGKYGWLKGETVVYCVSPWENKDISVSQFDEYQQHYRDMLIRHNPTKAYLFNTEDMGEKSDDFDNKLESIEHDLKQLINDLDNETPNKNLRSIEDVIEDIKGLDKEIEVLKKKE